MRNLTFCNKKFHNYPGYKNSETDWLKLLPTNWYIVKVRFLLKNGSEGMKIGPFGSALKLEEMVQKGIRVYGQENVINRNFKIGKRFISENKYNEMKVYTVKSGDILITMMGTSGKCQVVPHDAELGIIDSHLLKIRTNNKILPELFRLLIDETQEIRNQIIKHGKGSIMHGLNSTIVKELEIPLPPLDEQKSILKFLDKETAKIDTLIEKQKRLIQLLGEKRQAVISYAVTKGLNPNIKMKDSGVEWLGYVPEHWKIRRIKTLFQIKKRIAGTLGYDVLSITQKGIKVKDIESGEGQLSMDYTKYQLVNIGDFAMNHMDLLTGWVDIAKQQGVTSPDYRVFSLIEKEAHPKYYLYVLQMGYNQKIFYAYGQGSSHLGRWRFPTEAFQSFYFPFPPENEQKEISNFIENVHLKISNLVEKSKKAISLLNERRAALISAAVTGKIDVRNIT